MTYDDDNDNDDDDDDDDVVVVAAAAVIIVFDLVSISLNTPVHFFDVMSIHRPSSADTLIVRLFDR